MAQGSRLVSDVLRIMRLAISRRNTNDPDSNDATLLSYFNDFVSLTMSNDIRVKEQFGTLSFKIDENTAGGVYTFNDVGADSDFVSISNDAYISIYDPVNESTSWNSLCIYRDPGLFFSKWGINNEELLIDGFPTEMLFYGNEFTFRTIPEQEYIVNIYGYKKINDFSSSSDQIPYDHWLRYLAYGAALNYVTDYNFDEKKINRVRKAFSRETILMAKNRHNNIKFSRCIPQF